MRRLEPGELLIELRRQRKKGDDLSTAALKSLA
jgi:hypothetical protein